MNGQTLEEVDQFKYLGSTQTKDETSVKEVTCFAGAFLWNESWTLTGDLEGRIPHHHHRRLSSAFHDAHRVDWKIQAFENKCYRMMLGIS